MRNNKTKKNKKVVLFNKNDYNSDNGMLTSVWGPSLWHSLHAISFNYPLNPTKLQKRKHKEFITNLKYVLPCGHCRKNLEQNLKCLPIKDKDLKDRESFSKYVYNLHEHINNMLGKKSNLSYETIRDRYEHFRARCGKTQKKTKTKSKTIKKKKENGCVDPLYGKKSKCVIKIVPQETVCDTFQMNKKCETKRHIQNKTLKKDKDN